jgi:hypothetical protein
MLFQNLKLNKFYLIFKYFSKIYILFSHEMSYKSANDAG